MPEVTFSHVPEVTFSHTWCPPHGLDGEDGGDDVVCVMLAAGHVHEPVPGPADEDEAPGTEEAQQARPHKLRLASHILPVFRFRSHLSHETIMLENLREKIPDSTSWYIFHEQEAINADPDPAGGSRSGRRIRNEIKLKLL